MEFIDLKKQYKLHKQQIDNAIHAVLDHGQFIMGPEIQELEKQLAAYVGVKHCIAAASGTHTLEIALRAFGVGPGDEVITVPFTWISSAEVINLVGATPVFVDIDPVTYNIDVTKIEQAITPKTKAILPVNLYGQMPDYDIINQIAAKYNIPVIEDAAQSFGATQRGKKSCSMSIVGSTSFFPAKPLGCYGDGGALFTNDDALASKMRAMTTHGALIRHQHHYIGMNGRLDTIQAAILLAKLPHFPEEVKKRESIGAAYTEKLGSFCTPAVVAEGNTHVYAQYTIRVDDRESLGRYLKEQKIPTAVYYPTCVHLQPVYAYLGLKEGSFPEAEKAAKEVLSLPMHPWLTSEDIDRITSAIESFHTVGVA
jgi:UDP-2-acetamido-2-deoxy-ribo-hexuluronate aminotransferase